MEQTDNNNNNKSFVAQLLRPRPLESGSVEMDMVVLNFLTFLYQNTMHF